ncbi:Fe-S oxidoreductase [Thiohalobacter thiocyanaticus]|uniref:Fe-S oxidoreductase n=1 Tax=Thiohalobacter thiocyanaticus TaxID=585455 RepID=A0A1Z4VSP4_9GAMM|nr:(Fe-S)-binding protein [Thiohalobacter thiocyanaticus]BAZ94657.1 Fe-S oxidoreductase [Thiohalobacter thiocyanaticus]
MSPSLERGLNAFVNQIDGPIASYFNSCVHCGMCAHACLFYTETGDPKYTPIYKTEPLRRAWKQNFTFWGRLLSKLGLEKKITDEELAEWETLIYDGCTLCGRCTAVCPVGNDITYMIRKSREAMAASGHAPEGLKMATTRAIEIGSPMGVTIDTLKAQIKHTEKETGLTVPLDVEGAEYLMLLSSAEIAQFNEIIGAVTEIFDRAGVSWTLSSTAFEATNSGIQIGSSDLAAELVQRIVDSAERLGVRTVISPECGHAYTALRWEGPNLIGRSYPFEVKHILEVLDELRAEGRLQTSGRESARVTFHDPCQLVRRGGVVQQPRSLLNMVAEDFVEMPDAGVMNWCCGGGGGVSANERANPLRAQVFSRKKKQLDGLQVEKLVTACSNCRNMLEEGLEENRMEDIEVVGLTEMLAEFLPEKT